MVIARHATKLAGLGAAGGLIAYLTWPSPTKAARTSASEPMAPTHFTPATLVATNSFAGPSRLLSVTLPPATQPLKRPAGTIWSVYIKDADLQIERPYTPLTGIDADTGEMRFWVKRYDDGEVSRWICSRTVGDTVEVRGPVLTWSAVGVKDAFDEIVLVRGLSPHKLDGLALTCTRSGIRWNRYYAILPVPALGVWLAGHFSDTSLHPHPLLPTELVTASERVPGRCCARPL